MEASARAWAKLWPTFGNIEALNWDFGHPPPQKRYYNPSYLNSTCNKNIWTGYHIRFQISLASIFFFYNYRCISFQYLSALLMLSLYVTRPPVISRAVKMTFFSEFCIIYVCQIAENWCPCTETLKLDIKWLSIK